jgi:hypothetical protein
LAGAVRRSTSCDRRRAGLNGADHPFREPGILNVDDARELHGIAAHGWLAPRVLAGQPQARLGAWREREHFPAVCLHDRRRRGGRGPGSPAPPLRADSPPQAFPSAAIRVARGRGAARSFSGIRQIVGNARLERESPAEAGPSPRSGFVRASTGSEAGSDRRAHPLAPGSRWPRWLQLRWGTSW